MAIPYGNPSASSTDSLIELVQTKLHLLEQMHEMSIEQSNLVARHDMDGLMTLLSRKQSLMDSLRSVQTELIPFQSVDSEDRIWAHPSRRRECQEIVNRCDQLIQLLVAIENRSIDQMNLQREAVVAQLQQNVDAIKIESAYISSDHEPPSENGCLSLTG